eukprot:750396-Hanusia_phi.AAC.3
MEYTPFQLSLYDVFLLQASRIQNPGFHNRCTPIRLRHLSRCHSRRSERFEPETYDGRRKYPSTSSSSFPSKEIGKTELS